MDKRGWILFGAATIAILAGLVYFSRQERLDLDNVDHAAVITEEKTEEYNSGLPDNVLGNPDSGVVLVEYGDYSCNGCAALNERIKPVLEEYEDHIAFVYRHFPLTSIHPNSLVAASYAEAAGFQGKYWEYHDILSDNYEAWSGISVNERDDKLREYAEQIGLDMDRLAEDLQDPRIRQKTTFDLQLGRNVGVNATPTVYLNGELAGEAVGDMDKLRELLDAKIEEAGGTPPSANDEN